MILGIVIGAILTFALKLSVDSFKRKRLRDFKTRLLQELQRSQEEIKRKYEIDFQEKQKEHVEKLNHTTAEERRKLSQERAFLDEREQKISTLLSSLQEKIDSLEKKRTKIEEQEIRLAKEELALHHQLEKLASLSREDAKELILKETHQELEKEKAQLIQKSLGDVDSQLKRSLVTALERLEIATISDVTTSVFNLNDEEIKKRLIGKEGRNIRTLEQLTGVNFLFDEMPQAVVISGFDPERRQLAKLALAELTLSGKIYPTRIEEAVNNAKQNLKASLLKWGQEAAEKAEVSLLHPDLLERLGRLKLRSGYGQNTLDHSVEVALIMGYLAAELGLNASFARRIGLLHDIGKAESDPKGLSHALIGYNLALQAGESEEIAAGIGCHHGEMCAKSLEGSLTSFADAISASRPGARQEIIQNYLQRLSDVEKIALSFEGVDKAFALQAGKEVRILVNPSLKTDEEAQLLARSVAKKLTSDLNFPGKIKVIALRQTRVVEYAL